jgi:dolichyl-diphosphooligosaccharide--protein glycosyltransferase
LPREVEENWVVIALILIFFMAVCIRMVPSRHGTINDPDAFFMFRMARDIVEKGYYPVWDNLGWQPGGRSLTGEMPFLPYSIAYSYMTLRSLGLQMSLNSWTIIFPAIFGSLSIFPAFLIGREIRDRITGLVGAFLLATIPEYLNRTMAGVADKECLALPLMLIGFALLFVMLREERVKRRLLLSIGAGFTFGLLALTWGGFTYILLLFTVFYGAILLTDILGLVSVPDDLLISLIAVSAIMVLIASTIRNWGLGNPFILIHVLSILALVAYLLLTRVAVEHQILSRRTAVVVFVAAIVFAGSFPFVGSELGVVRFKVARKFIILLNPFETPEEGMHVTVQEYAHPTISDWLSRYSFYPFLALAGAILGLRRRRLQDILLILWAASGAYAGFSAVRNTMILTPALCILSAFAIVEFLSLLSRTISIRNAISSGPRRVESAVKDELRMAKIGAPLAVLAVIVITAPSIILGLQLVEGRGPVIGQGWYDALMWLRRETPEDSIVVAWWDYGHWITSLAERRCVSDGATTNFSTIQATAYAYLSPEDVAADIFQRYDVEYVAVPEHDFWLVGAFAQIVGNITDFPEGYYELNRESGSVSWQDLTEKAQNTTIYRLLFARTDPEEKNFELLHVSPGSSSSSDTTVRIYRFNPD